MDEGHAAPSRPHARRLVDERDAVRLQGGERGLDVVHEDAHVMEAGALLQELRDDRAGVGGLQELQVRLADGQERRLHLLGGHVVHRLDLEAERAKGPERLLHVLHRDAEVVDLQELHRSPILPRRMSAAPQGSSSRRARRSSVASSSAEESFDQACWRSRWRTVSSNCWRRWARRLSRRSPEASASVWNARTAARSSSMPRSSEATVFTIEGTCPPWAASES